METLSFYFKDEGNDADLVFICRLPLPQGTSALDWLNHLAAETRVTSSKPVEVTEVDQDRYKPFRINPKPGRAAGGELPGPRAFKSAREASTYIGCRSNEVAQALGTARRHGETKAVVRGVTFRYIEDAPD